MSVWDDYREGLGLLSYALEQLQADSVGRWIYIPGRFHASPACCCILKNGLSVYSEWRPAFAPFASLLLGDGTLRDWEAPAFQQPIYDELRRVVEDEIRRVDGAGGGVSI